MSYIKGFARYSPDWVVLNNDYFWKFPWWLKLVKFDVVIFHHSVTTPWSRARYQSKTERLHRWFGNVPYKIALFQDEYFNSDLSVEFINRLGIDHVYSVAPESQWPNIYKGVNRTAKFTRVLTGYIDPDDLPEDVSAILDLPRTVDVGYRSDWTPALFRLGYFGYMKVLIAERFLAARGSRELKTDVVVGRTAFLRGEKWLRFLRRCRYVLGAESGSSVLDEDGSISSQISKYVYDHPQADFSEVREACLQGKDGTLALRALSPRHFEAILCGCGQILTEGDYNGVLKAGRHYLSIEKDFGNFEEVIERTKDESLRRQMVDFSYREIALNSQYQYPELVRIIWSSMPEPGSGSRWRGLEVLAASIQQAMNSAGVGLSYVLAETRRRRQ